MNSLFKLEHNTVLFAKIISKESAALCTVQDRKGRVYNAASNGSYKVGQQVMVKNGVIVTAIKRPSTVQHFNV